MKMAKKFFLSLGIARLAFVRNVNKIYKIMECVRILISIILNIPLKITVKFETPCINNEIKFTPTSSIELLGSKYDKDTYPRRCSQRKSRDDCT